MNALVLARQSGNEKESTIDMMDRRAALAALPKYTPGRTVPGAIKLTSNEMPFPPLDVVVRAVTEAATGMNRYPDNAAQGRTAKLAARFDAERISPR